MLLLKSLDVITARFLVTITNVNRNLSILKSHQKNFCTMSNQIKGMKLSEVVKRLETITPKWLAASWDNVGLLVEADEENKMIKKIFCTNDLTEVVMKEATEKNADLIISYHPPLFRAIKTITKKNWKTRIFLKCIATNCAVYSPHTALDSIENGINDWLIKVAVGSIATGDVKPITAAPNAPLNVQCSLDLTKCGEGRIITLNNSISLNDIVENVKKNLKLPFIQLATAALKDKNCKISTIAVCAGSGSSVLSNISADLYLTGEMSHHDVLEAVHKGTSVILTHHSNSERGYINEIYVDLIKQALGPQCDIIIDVSQNDKDQLTIC